MCLCMVNLGKLITSIPNVMKRIYQNKITHGLLRPDSCQEFVVHLLDGLGNRLEPYHRELVAYRKEKKQVDDEQIENMKKGKDIPVKYPNHPRKPKGLYLHGNVGTGKTILMDMFYESVNIPNKRRVHLHDFMIEVHERIHSWKKFEREKFLFEQQEQLKFIKEGFKRNPDDIKETERFFAKESDAITQIARRLSEENTLLAFDEFVVTDVVDALILKHLFGEMFLSGSVVVATSNTKPENLYKNGLNYYYFAPFIGLLQSHCKTCDIDSIIDYRVKESVNRPIKNYFYPLSMENKNLFNLKFEELAGTDSGKEMVVSVAFGRKLKVPCSANGVCKFDFEDLCGDFEPVMGSADFQALCTNFHTIMIDNVPRLGRANHNETRRFIILVDQLYDKKIKLVINADAPPMELFDSDSISVKSGDLLSLKEMGLASTRMASRLTEMCIV